MKIIEHPLVKPQNLRATRPAGHRRRTYEEIIIDISIENMEDSLKNAYFKNYYGTIAKEFLSVCLKKNQIFGEGKHNQVLPQDITLEQAQHILISHGAIRRYEESISDAYFAYDKQSFEKEILNELAGARTNAEFYYDKVWNYAKKYYETQV